MKRVLAILMTLLMLLAGTTALAVEVSAPGELPIVTEPVTLTFLVTEHPGIIDWNTNEFILWLEETTGVNLEFDYVPLAERTEKLNLVLATGDFPDVIFGMGGSFTAAALQQGIQDGLFLPLNDLIDEHCVEVHKLFEQFPGARGLLTQLDGNIYSMPRVNECYHCTMASKYWINRQWLDNLGLEMPTTIDEFYDVLVAFRDQDANGNGDLSDEIPMAGAYTGGWYTRSEMFIMNAFTHYDLELNDPGGSTMRAFGLYLDGDTVVVPFDQPALKDGLKFMHKLVDEGLFYVGSFTQNDEQLTQLAENESANLLGGTMAGYNSFTQMGGERYREYDVLLPLVGPDGFQNQVVWPHDSIITRNYVISAECEYPEVAIKLADFMLTLESSLRSYYGVEGVDWKWAEEGQIGMNGEPAIYEQLTPWQDIDPQNQHITQYGLEKLDAAFRFGVVAEPDTDIYSAEGLELYLLQATQALEPYGHPERTIPPLKFSTEETEALAVIRAELATAIQEGMIGFMIGTRDVDADYDAFMADLEAKGLRTLIEAYQKAYDEQYK